MANGYQVMLDMLELVTVRLGFGGIYLKYYSHKYGCFSEDTCIRVIREVLMKAALHAESIHRPTTGDLSIEGVFLFAFVVLVTFGLTVAIAGIGWPLRIGLILLQTIKQSTVNLAGNLSSLFLTPSNGATHSSSDEITNGRYVSVPRL